LRCGLGQAHARTFSPSAVCGWDEQGYVSLFERESIRRECEENLRRLDVDMIDLYQIHWPTDDLEEGWSTMAQLQKEGKSADRRINFDVAELASRAKDRSHHFASTSVFP